ncbi:ribonuclease H-like domain-containing protein [Mycena haematopus]|nr:ribonuclease H-like domain-containing protein [Mycena haematopus]
MPRSFRFCSGFNLRGEDTSTHIYDLCDFCWRFFARCCLTELPHRVCHDHPLVFVDGSCPRNGQPDAHAGIGMIDRPLPPENQSACRALGSTVRPAHAHLCGSQKPPLCPYSSGVRAPGAPIRYRREYVVKGITEWVPAWKANNWKNKQGLSPQNLDLFKQLDDAVVEYEGQGFKIQFLHVKRELNYIADELATRATAQPVVA